MFKSLDTLVAFATIMLMLSMAVTVITQALTGVVNSRGWHLKRGIQDLLRLLDPKLPAAMSNAIANAVLSHPLISGSSWLTPGRDGGIEGRLASIVRWVLGPRLGTVILREEFTRILMHFASDDGAADVPPEISQYLKRALAANGIADPGQTLSNIRARVLEIERFQPELGHAARQSTAVLREAATEYVAKINSGDLVSIAEVVRDLYRSEAQPEQSYSERQLYEDALDRMAREIAAVEKLDERGAVQRITDVLSKSARGRRLAAEAEGGDAETRAA